jgi:sec-independent protein translocase protein TatA
MFGIGTAELLIIFAVALLVFGASRLPALGKGLGQGIRSFRDAMRDMNLEDAENETEQDSTKPPLAPGKQRTEKA